MPTIIGATKVYEDIYLDDPKENPSTPHWRVSFDDKNCDRLLNVVSNAFLRIPELTKTAEGGNEAESASATDEIVDLQRRVIVAFIGDDGYNEVLTFIGDDEAPADPRESIIALGNVFAAFMNLLDERASSRKLRSVANSVCSQPKNSRPKKKARR